MRFVTTADHRHFFNQNGHRIRFAELLREGELRELNLELEKVMSERMGCPRIEVGRKSQQEQVLSGRNLWRDGDLFKKIVTRRSLAQILGELAHRYPLRLAYDQFLVATQTAPNRKELYSGAPTLPDISCFQGIHGGVLLCLRGGNPDGDEEDLYSMEPGDALFFGEEAEFSFDTLFGHDTLARYLLIVYGGKNLVYTPNALDPHAHRLKDDGYVFGDNVREQTHPTIVTKV